jgi:hypothetical protein
MRPSSTSSELKQTRTVSRRFPLKQGVRFEPNCQTGNDEPDRDGVSAEELKSFQCLGIERGDCKRVSAYDAYAREHIPELSSLGLFSTMN